MYVGNPTLNFVMTVGTQGTFLHPFMFLYIHNCLEMWFVFCNTDEHAL